MHDCTTRCGSSRNAEKEGPGQIVCHISLNYMYIHACAILTVHLGFAFRLENIKPNNSSSKVAQTKDGAMLIATAYNHSYMK